MDDADVREMLRDSVVNFLEGHQELSGRDALPGEPKAINRELWVEMAELGWLGLALPEEVGGSGLGLREAAVLTQLFGQYTCDVPYIAAVVMPSVILAASGEAFAKQLAGELATGERLFTLAWQEKAGEIESGDSRTRQSADGRVDGKKCFVPAAEGDSVLLVSANAGDEPVIVAIDTAAEDVSKYQSATALGSVSEITLEGVKILGEGPLLRGAEARRVLSRSLEAGRIALAAQMAGLAGGCLAKTLTHVSDRVQFGRPLSGLQSVRHRCADMHMAILLANASLHRALGACEATPDGSEMQAAVSAAKARCAETALQVARGSVQLHGAMGFTEEGGVGRYLRGAMAGSGWLGSPTAHRRRFLSAQGLLSHA